VTDSAGPECPALDAHKELFVGAPSARSGWERIASKMGGGSELFIASPWRVPKFGKRLFKLQPLSGRVPPRKPPVRFAPLIVQVEKKSARIRKTAMIFSLRSSNCLTAAFSQTNRWFCSASQSEFVTMEKPPIEDDAAREPLVCQENSGEGTDHPCWKMTADVESPFFLHSSESLREQAAISF
jgi:hypothetical protein